MFSLDMKMRIYQVERLDCVMLKVVNLDYPVCLGYTLFASHCNWLSKTITFFLRIPTTDWHPNQKGAKIVKTFPKYRNQVSILAGMYSS